MSAPVSSFVGPVTKIQGRMNAGPDEILVILRNGRPDRVVEPGRRVGRAWGAPLTGALDVIQVNATSTTMRLTIKDVLTSEQERYTAPSVTVEFTVRLGVPPGPRLGDGRPDYSGFGRLVRAEGTRFPEVLLVHMRSGVERLVRDAFLALTHEKVFAARDRVLDGAVPRVIDGLMTVTSARLAEVVWDEAFTDARRHEAVLTASSQAAAREAAAILDRITALTPVAQRTGVSVLQMVFPDQHEAALARQHELVKTILGNPALVSRVSRDPLLQQALGIGDGGVGFQATAIVTGAHQTGVIDPGRVVPAAGATLPLSGAGHVGTPVNPDHTLALPQAPGAGADLTIDQRLRRAWESGQASMSGVIGLAGAAAGGRVVVVVVGAQSRPTVSDQVVTRLAGIYQAAPVTVLPLTATTAEDLALDWFTQMRGGLADAGQLRARVEVDSADRLWINVSGPMPAARSAVKFLTSPDEAALAALAAVMPFADVCVQLDGHL